MITKILIGGLLVDAIRYYKPLNSKTFNYIIDNLGDAIDIFTRLSWVTFLI